jgi:hypothetical protein
MLRQSVRCPRFLTGELRVLVEFPPEGDKGRELSFGVLFDQILALGGEIGFIHEVDGDV